MSKKQFEHIENKFREAAENFQPSLNQGAWERMEVLLDKEVNRKPRPGGFWFTSLLLLIIGGGLGIYLVTQNQTRKQDVMVMKTASPENNITNNTTAKKDKASSVN